MSGCTVTAGDGGVDAPEANGIACSGTTAANDPLCTEQFKNNALATLKVTTEPGYGFTGWIVDGAHMQMTSAEPLFLSTRPVLADNGSCVQVKNGSTETQADCSPLTVYLTFDDGPIAGTDDVVNILKKHVVKSTLFMVGFHTYVDSEKSQTSFEQLLPCERELWYEPEAYKVPIFHGKNLFFPESPDRIKWAKEADGEKSLIMIGNHSYIPLFKFRQ